MRCTKKTNIFLSSQMVASRVQLSLSMLLHLHIYDFHLICSEVIREPMFWVVATASGLLGLAISFSSVWFLHETGPTTYR